jgi:branched-chain amino acid transport system substrate-binding protein
MKGLSAWIVFGLCAAACLYWIGSGVRDDLHERAVFKGVALEREELAREAAENPGGEVPVGLAGDWARHGRVLAGAELAADELNGSGGLLGRKVRLVPKDDHGTVDQALAVAQDFCNEPAIPFVLGHTDPRINRFVAQNYEFYGVLLFSPCATLGGDVRPDLQFTEALSADQLGEALLDLAGERGWGRIGLVYTKSPHHQRQATRFESLAGARGVAVPLSFSHTRTDQSLTEEMRRWKRELDLDAMILSVDEDEAPAIIRTARAEGIGFPVVCTETLDTSGPGALSPQEPAARGVWVLAPYTRRDPARAAQADPRLEDARFAQGYEALMLLAQAAKDAATLEPREVARALADLQADGFPAGTVSFTRDGDAVKLEPRFRELAPGAPLLPQAPPAPVAPSPGAE